MKTWIQQVPTSHILHLFRSYINLFWAHLTLSLLHRDHHDPPALHVSAFPPQHRVLFVCGQGATYGHRGQCQPNRSEHWGGDGAALVGVPQAGVTAVETPLVRANRGSVQNQAGQHCYTHMNGCMNPHTHTYNKADPQSRLIQGNTLQRKSYSPVSWGEIYHVKTHICTLASSPIRLLTEQTLPCQAAPVDSVTPGYWELRFILQH